FASAADAVSAGPRGIESTLLRSINNSGSPDTAILRLLEPATSTTTDPLRRFELLVKLMNNLTTRSNVFAVWATAGFFEVVDDSTLPVKLGAEMVWPNTQATIRKRMFAILDRTQLQVWPTTDDTLRPTVRSRVAITAGPTPVPVQLMNAAGAA